MSERRAWSVRRVVRLLNRFTWCRGRCTSRPSHPNPIRAGGADEHDSPRGARAADAAVREPRRRRARPASTNVWRRRGRAARSSAPTVDAGEARRCAAGSCDARVRRRCRAASGDGFGNVGDAGHGPLPRPRTRPTERGERRRRARAAERPSARGGGAEWWAHRRRRRAATRGASGRELGAGGRRRVKASSERSRGRRLARRARRRARAAAARHTGVTDVGIRAPEPGATRGTSTAHMRRRGAARTGAAGRHRPAGRRLSMAAGGDGAAARQIRRVEARTHAHAMRARAGRWAAGRRRLRPLRVGLHRSESEARRSRRWRAGSCGDGGLRLDLAREAPKRRRPVEELGLRTTNAVRTVAASPHPRTRLAAQQVE